MRRRWTSAGWVVFWATATASIAGAGSGAGCGRSTGFDFPGQSNGAGGGSPSGGATGLSNTGGSNGSNVTNGTGGSNGAAVAGLTGGSGAGSPGTGTSAGSISATGTSTGGNSTGTCMTTADCPDLETLCVMGSCTPNFCGAHGVGPHNGELDGTCDAVSTNDGSCIPQTLNGTNVGLCSQAGKTKTACDPLAVRPNFGDACIAGDVCLLQAGHARCLTLCDPDARAPCGSGMDCIMPLSSNPRLGVCEPSSGATGGSTGGTGGSGGTTGGCSESAPISEFQPCTSTADCGCPLVCIDDPLQELTSSVCEYPCPDTGCPDPVTICGDAGVCITEGCGPGTGNGTFNSTCNVSGVDDGTCLPELLGDTSVGYCFLSGTASFDAGGCSLIPATSEPTELCPAGALCFGVGDDGTCSDLCDPNAGTGCPSGSFCAGIVDQPDLGICILGF